MRRVKSDTKKRRPRLTRMTEKLELFGLAYGCPNEPRRNGCPLKKIDHLAFVDKVAWIERLSEDEIRELIVEHKDCSCSSGF